MKILQTKIINKFIKNSCARAFTTKLYPNDMVYFKQMHNNNLTLMDRFKILFGLHPKLNAKSFASGKESYRGPYVASAKSVRQTNDYIHKNTIGFDSEIVNGFRDAGRNAKFTKFGDIINFRKRNYYY